MMLDVRVEISDEIVELFGYSFYARNQEKSLEAKELFEKLFSELQSELQKEYKNAVQRLNKLENRLKIVECSAAYSEDVERALNNFNNRITRIESNVDNYKRQQDAIAANMEQIEATVDTLYTTLNGKIEKLEKNFKTELNSEVVKAVDAAVKNILATDLSSVIQKAVEDTVKDATPAPDIDEKIQAEVAKAVGNIQPPNFTSIIQTEVAKAVGNIQPPDFSNKIQAEVINTVKKTSAFVLKSMIQAEVAKAVGSIQPPNFTSIIQTEVAKAVGNIQPPNFTSIIQTEVAKAVKEERQKTQAGNAIYPSSYLTLQQQRNNIKELKELVDTQQKVIEELKARLSAVEGKTATVKFEPATEEYTPLIIRDESSWLEYKKRLKDIGKLKLFAEKNPVEFKIFASRLRRIETAIDKIKPNEFDEYTTEIITDKTVDVVKDFIEILDTCKRKIGNPAKNSVAAQELYDFIEEYLSRLGVHSMNFKVGDDYHKWADLAMSEMPITESTSDRRKHDTLKEIYIQPHYIEFINEHDKKIRRTFGGKCVVYAYEDKGDDYGRISSRN